MDCVIIIGSIEIREFPAANVVAHCCETNYGPAFVAYKGRKSKAERSRIFSNVETRDRELASFVEFHEGVEARKRQEREAVHGLAVGDIVYSIWGYEQTNVTFYEVVRVPSARTATVRKLKANWIESEPCSMRGTSTPRPGEYVENEKPRNRRATGWHTLGELEKWNGKPCPVTSWH